LALSSILNEATNLHEACFPTATANSFYVAAQEWGCSQDWEWSNIQIRFTRWPVLEIIKPFNLIESSNDRVRIAGRNANNAVKHDGELASLRDTVEACAAAWFLVVERAREAHVYRSQEDVDQLLELFDCYDWVDFRDDGFGTIFCRPLATKVSYPSVRGRSEEALAKSEYQRRLDDRRRRNEDDGQTGEQTTE